MEQQARYDSIVTFVKPSAGVWNPWDPQLPIRGTIPTISCPSDTNSKVDSNTATRTSIVHSLGDTINNNTSMTNTVAVGGRSAFVRSGWKNLATIVDGTSNTIAASETKVPNNNDNREAGLSAMNAVTSLDTDPRQCLDYLDPSEKKFYKSIYTFLGTATPDTYDARRGWWAFYCPPNFTGFCTVLPPNTANCSSGNRDAWGTYSAASRHSGGVNVALFDGSVRFIPDTINCVSTGITTPKQVTSGPSEFGVWGAMGSISGSESVVP